MSNSREKDATDCMTEAAEWYWTIREADVSDDEIAAWQTWLSASPSHRRAFERIETALELVDAVDAPAWPTEEQLVADQYDGSMPVGEWLARDDRAPAGVESMPAAAPRFRRPNRAWALAASLVAVTVISAALQFRPWNAAEAPPDYVLYQTRPAEHRDILLPDGSSVALGGKSTISVAYQQNARIVVLQEGEAYFTVAKDSLRPFTVEAQGRDITAVGTAFNVSRQDARVVVTVTEGTVIVVPESASGPGQATDGAARAAGEIARLEAGHKLIYDARAVMPISVADPGDAIAWRQGLLKYRGEPLQYVVEDVARYVKYPITLGDDAVGEVLFTGTVFQGSADTWVFGLGDAFPVEVSETANGVVIKMKSDITH